MREDRRIEPFQLAHDVLDEPKLDTCTTNTTQIRILKSLTVGYFHDLRGIMNVLLLFSAGILG